MDANKKCVTWADQGSDQCVETAENGTYQCKQWVDHGSNQCCTWAPCRWACKAFYWVANLVCDAYEFISNIICKVMKWISKWVCTLWVQILTNIGFTDIKALSLISLLDNTCGLEGNNIEKNGWVITFNDEFNNTTLDLSKWRPQPGWGLFHAKNIIEKNTAPGEYFDLSCLRIENGNLIIETFYDPKPFTYTDPNTNWTGIINHKTGWVQPKNFQQKYGFYEIRCKIPKEERAWPAFWLIGQDWPPEIDVFEIFTTPSDKKKVLLSNLHWGKYTTTQKESDEMLEHIICDSSDNFNIYGMEWNENYIKWYYNNKLIRKRSIKELEQFHNQDMILIINCAVQQDEDNPSPTGLYHKFEIDYIRVYKKK